MSGLEAIDGDGSVAAFDCNCKVFVSSLYYRVRAIIGWLEGFTDSIVTDEHMCGCCKSIHYVGGPVCESRRNWCDSSEMGSEVVEEF